MGFKPVILSFILLMFLACSGQKEDKIVVSVFDTNLYHSDIVMKTKGKNLSYDDSVKFVSDFIKHWTDEQILVHYAKSSDKIEIDDIDYRAMQYRNTLLIHQYQNLKITEQLDTTISMSEIKAYYESHKTDFLLKDYLVKVIYIKVAEDAPEIDKVARWYRLNKETDLDEIRKYVSLYATNFYYDEENWVYFDEITKEIPLHDINKDRFITRKSAVKFSEDGYYYFLNIIDYKLKDAASPIEFETDNIRQRILNTRIYDLREKIKNELIQSAHEQNAIKIH